MNENEPGTARRSRGLLSGRHALIGLFVVIFLFGVALRVQNLGKYGFWTDELFHVISANSILKIGAPIVPGMTVYNRAYPFTRLISVSFKYFGMNETVGRVPSVLFNLLFIVIGYISIRYLFNEYLAAIFSIVMILSPFEIIWARECRMYALFQLMYFSASILFILGFEPCIADNKIVNYRIFPTFENKLDVNLLLLGLSAFIFLLTTIIHALVYNFVFVFLSYCIVMMGMSLLRREGKSIILSKYFMSILLVVAGGLSVVFLSPKFVSKTLDMINEKPFWDTRNIEYVYYIKYLFLNYPFFLLVYPAGMYFMIRKYGKIGIFMVCSFVPLMLMHCFLFVNNIDERYLFYIFPFFILCSVCVIEYFGSILLNQIQNAFSGGKYYSKGLAVVLFAGMIGIAGYPWVGHAVTLPNHAVFDDWKSVEKELKSISGNGIIVSTRRMSLYYYMGRNPDYVIIKTFEDLIREKQKKKSEDLSYKLLYLDVDWIFNRKELGDLVSGSDNVFLVVDKSSFNNPAFLDNDLRSYIKEEGELLSHDGDKKVIIYKMKQSKK